MIGYYQTKISRDNTLKKIKRKNVMFNRVLRIGEGKGTPLQYSCLENPMDGGGW